MFLSLSVLVFEIAGRLASEQRPGWGWFLFAGLILAGVAHDQWTGKALTSRCTCDRKPDPIDDLD
jgi:hypothetical protein